MSNIRALICFCILSAFVFYATAGNPTTDVREPDVYSWGENVGFLNFNGVPNGMNTVQLLPVRLNPTTLSGFVWAENIGWVNLGNGMLSDGNQYQNIDGTDFGVNIDPASGDLFGFAWGENVGWINFDTRTSLASFSQHARLNTNGMRLNGYAWGENIGWVNLDDEIVHIRFKCAVDFNNDNAIDFFDISLFLQNRFDLDNSGVFDFFDISSFLSEFALGCPE